MTDSLYGRLKELANSDFYPFHMPGHKRNFPEGILPAWYSMDISEIDGFDNLHQAKDILLQSQQKAAGLYQADETWFLVGGSTAGILSAFSTVAAKNKKILIARNSHLSVYHGAYLNDTSLVYLYPAIDEQSGIAAGIRATDVAGMLAEHDDIGAVIITSPTYEGVISDVGTIAEVVHNRGVPLIIDQAHGAHFGFHPGFPQNALAQGADLVIHGLHKTLPAPTQTALIHVKGRLVDRERLKRYLRIFQSSSPSYPLMAGIDYCIELMRGRGWEMMEYLLALRDDFMAKIRPLHFIRIVNKSDDPAKVVITAKGWSGHKLAGILREKYHLEMEMALDDYVIAIFTMMDKPEGINRLAQALGEIENMIESDKGGEKSRRVNYRHYPLKTAVTVKTALDGVQEKIFLSDAAGRVAAEFIFIYPPGIPLVVPGEILDHEQLKLIEQYRLEKDNIQGVSLVGEIKVLL